MKQQRKVCQLVMGHSPMLVPRRFQLMKKFGFKATHPNRGRSKYGKTPLYLLLYFGQRPI
eukprot:8660505-Prorocentrum_lima.AAC.1